MSLYAGPVAVLMTPALSSASAGPTLLRLAVKVRVFATPTGPPNRTPEKVAMPSTALAVATLDWVGPTNPPVSGVRVTVVVSSYVTRLPSSSLICTTG